jgi:hypothetical protein
VIHEPWLVEGDIWLMCPGPGCGNWCFTTEGPFGVERACENESGREYTLFLMLHREGERWDDHRKLIPACKCISQVDMLMQYTLNINTTHMNSPHPADIQTSL